jgi:hypothetical protein
MLISRIAGVGLAVLFSHAACSSGSAVDSRLDGDPRLTELVSIRVAGFVKAAGIT